MDPNIFSRPTEILVIIKEPIMFHHSSDGKEMFDLYAQQVRQIIAQTLVDPQRP